MLRGGKKKSENWKPLEKVILKKNTSKSQYVILSSTHCVHHKLIGAPIVTIQAISSAIFLCVYQAIEVRKH